MKLLIILLMALPLDKETKSIYLSLDKTVRRAIDEEMVIFKKQMENETQKALLDVQSYTASNSKVPKKVIAENLTRQRDELDGMFGGLSKSVLATAGKTTFSISDEVFFGGIQDETTYDINKQDWTWVAVLTNTCPSCLSLHGYQKTLVEWDSSGGRPRSRDTFCGSHCQCNLILSDIAPDQKELLKPIKQASKKLRRAEKIRGKKYSKSYETALIGSFNNRKSKLRDLRKIKKV